MSSPCCAFRYNACGVTLPPPQEQGKKPLWQRRAAAIPLYAAFLLGLLWVACTGFEAAPAERVVLTPPPPATATPAKPAPGATPDTGDSESTPAATPDTSVSEPMPAATPSAKAGVPTSYFDYSFVQLTAGEHIFCGLQQDGEAVCWGNAAKDTEAAIGRAVSGEMFHQITAGKEFFCGIREYDGTISCGGKGDHDKTLPPAGEFTAVAAGKQHACALDAAGAATCWGWDKDGRATAPDGITFTAIDAGGTHSCGLDAQGSLHCWGNNPDGRADAQPGPFQALALGVKNTCALRGDGTVFCQGDDLHGQSRPPDTAFVQISVGQEHGCGVTEVGSVACWGAKWASKGLPPGRFVAVSAGWYETCGLRPGGSVECWGPADAGMAVAFGGRRFNQPVELFPWPEGATGPAVAMAVVERRGVISAYSAEGDALGTILNLADRTYVSGELGMVSAALDPNFDDFPFLYVYYHRTDDGAAGNATGRLTRFPVVNGQAARREELAILELPQVSDGHQGGAIRFGPDGMLYLGLGDNGVDANGQDLATLHGTIIRIDVRGATAEQPYRIPADNPFVTVPGARPEVWAYGLRNPWRMSFDRRGRLWVGDVGASAEEELSVATAGANLGWPVFEGNSCYAAGAPCAALSRATAPVLSYGRGQGCAITGAAADSRYEGVVFFSDLCSGRVWALTGDTGDGRRMREVARVAQGILSLAVGADGEVYALVFYGPILRLELPE